jgi:DNA-binding transcriptional ArsR family regulator
MTGSAESAEPVSGFEFFSADPDLIRHLSHPMRMRVYRLAVRAPVSAKELAELFGEPLARVSYHVRALADAGLLRPVRRTQRRGAVETHYRAMALLDFTDEVVQSLPEEIQRTLYEIPVREMAADILKAVEDGSLDDPDTLLSRAHFVATTAGRERLREEVLGMYKRLARLQQELAAEVEASAGETTHELNVCLIEYFGDQSHDRNSPWVISRDRPGEPPLDPIPPD